MSKGKQTCKILKDIRKQIAEVNDIEYITSECRYKGDCLGTCPKCEAEIRYLEQALERKRLAGKVVSLLGISVGLMASPQMVCGMDEEAVVVQEAICSSVDTVTVKGRVKDSEGNPIAGATVLEKETKNGTCSDRDGHFTLRVSGKLPLIISFVGYKSKEVKISRDSISDLQVVLNEERILLGEAPVLVGMRPAVEVKGVFVVEGGITDEEGTPLSGVVISRKWKGEKLPESKTDREGKFWLYVKRRGYFWFSKEGYQIQKVKFTKRNSSGARVVLKKKDIH